MVYFYCKFIGVSPPKGKFNLKQYTSDKIKNIALLGHAGSGKTTLADAILFLGGAISHIGKNADSTLTLDFDPEEKKRKASVSMATYPIEWNDYKINLFDAPGLFDFAGGSREALTAADSAVIVLSGKSGFTVGAQQSYDLCVKNDKPVAFFVNKLDSKSAQYYRILSILTGKYGGKICPVFVPLVKGEATVGYVDLITGKGCTFEGATQKEASIEYDDNINNMRTIMLEAVASVNEQLMEKYFNGEEFTQDEIIGALKEGFIKGELCPVFCGVSQEGAGVKNMLDVLSEISPALCDKTVIAQSGEDIASLSGEKSGETVIYCFKTIADPFVGKLSYFKVLQGSVKQDTKLINARGGEEKLSKVMYVKGAKQEDAPEIIAGDIGAVSKMQNLLTGDTLSASGKVKVSGIDYPLPNTSVAVYPKNKGEEEKISAGLRRLCEEDPTITYETSPETKESILSGLGDQHIDVVVSKLKSKFGVDVELRAPKVAYRETIRKSVKVQGRHKKQSGGHGQFGDVWIEFSPCEEDFVFEEKIFGGSVPKNFHPAVEKGLRECMQKGVLAGYPMVGVKAVLVDGSYHPVDSSEMSFKLAAAEAYKAGIAQASPVLMEPIGALNAIVPDDYLGDVIGDINKRRGRVIGMNPLENHEQEVIAEVPISEMSDFATAMRSITQGRASFTLKFERYEDVPPQFAQKIIDAAKTE